MDMEAGKLIRDLPKGLISWYEFQKRGKVVYYSLDDGHVKEIYQKGLEHVEEL